MLNAAVRKEAKRKSKRAVRDCFWRSIGMYTLTVLMIMVIAVLMAVGMLAAFLPALIWSRGFDAQMGSAATVITLFPIGVMLLTLLLSGLPALPLVRYYIGLQKDSPLTIGQSFSSAFRSGRDVWNGMKLMVCLTTRGVLWALVVYLALGLSAFLMVTLPGLGTILLIAFWVAVFGAYMAKMVSYQGAWVLMAENPILGAWQATRMSGEYFKGQLGQLFVYLLSFWPWTLLSSLLTSIVGTCGENLSPQTAAVVSVVGLLLELVLTGFLLAYMSVSFFEIFSRQRGQESEESAPTAEADGLSFGDGTNDDTAL